MDLFSYFFTGDLNKKINILAEMTGEKWSVDGNNDNSVLKNYILNTFIKLYNDNQIIETDNYCLLHTGLFNQYYDPIYIYGTINTEHSSSRPQKWYLNRFVTDYDLGKLTISERPSRANYFNDTTLLVFDVNYSINIQTEHILSEQENLKRFPKELQNNPMIATLFIGAVETMKKKVMANYKLAIPQYYDNKIQLLLPLCLQKPNEADVALVVTRFDEGHFYQGHTCLSIEMAYNNARLIAKPDSNWLRL